MMLKWKMLLERKKFMGKKGAVLRGENFAHNSMGFFWGGEGYV